MATNNSFMQDFFAGIQAGQQEKSAKLAEADLQEQRSIEKMVLQQRLRELKIHEAIQKRTLAKQNFEMVDGQPAASFPQAMTGVEMPALPTGTGFGMMTPPVPTIEAQVPSMEIPGVEELGVQGVTMKPRTMEDVLRAQAEAKLREAFNAPFELGEGQTRYVGGRPIATNPRQPKVQEPPAVGSFEDYTLRFAREQGVKPEELTPAQIETARKKYQQADDRPRITVNTSGAGSDAEAIADAIISGDQPPDLKGLYRLGAPVRALLARKGYDFTTASRDWTATQRYLNTLNGPQQVRVRQATDFAYHSLDLVEDLAGKWAGGKFPTLNKVKLAAAKGGLLGGQAQQIATELDAQINDLVAEVANVYMGGNSPTDHALKLAAANLSSDWTEAQLKSAVKLLRKNLEIRRNSLNSAGVGGTVNNAYEPAKPTATTPAPGVNVGGFIVRPKGGG